MCLSHSGIWSEFQITVTQPLQLRDGWMGKEGWTTSQSEDPKDQETGIRGFFLCLGFSKFAKPAVLVVLQALLKPNPREAQFCR